MNENLFSKIALTVVCCLFCLSREVYSVKTIKDLDSEISNLSSATIRTQADLNTALFRFQAETNLSQGPLLVGGIVPAKSGDTISWPISFLASSFTVSGVQANIVVPSSFTIASITAGPEAIADNKSVSSNGGTFIVFGLNQFNIHDGVLAIAQIKVPTNARPGFYTICLGDPTASNVSGKSVLISATSGTIEVK